MLPRIGVLALGLALSAGSAAGCAGATKAGGPAVVSPPSPAVASSVPSGTSVASNPSAKPGSPAPDGRVSRATLMRTKLNLPSWPTGAPATCATRNVKLADPHTDRHVPVLMWTLLYGDVDGDAAQETIALLSCESGQTTYEQVVVFDRDATGHVVTLGQVVRMGGDIAWIVDVSVAAPGSVRVRVADIPPCCPTEQENTQYQWRTYSWNGTTFQQTGGPKKFGVNPLRSDLKITTSGITFAARQGDTRWWHGTITVTIHNGGPGRADQIQVQLHFPKLAVRHEGAGWSGCAIVSDDPRYPDISCHLRTPLAAGETRTLVLGVASSQPMTGKGEASVAQYLLDLAYADNKTTFAIR
jgi:hypothetical protein